MDNLIKLVRTCRVTSGLAERLRLAEEIFRQVEPDMRFFIFGAIQPPSAEDVLQETLKSISVSLPKFAGSTEKEFWKWCYRIARNRLGDHFRAKKASERLQIMPTEEIWQMVEASTEVTPLETGERLDLEYAMNLLTASKPECRDYLWNHFVIGLDYAEIAEENDMNYDAARMKVGRCLDEIRSLVA